MERPIEELRAALLLFGYHTVQAGSGQLWYIHDHNNSTSLGMPKVGTYHGRRTEREVLEQALYFLGVRYERTVHASEE